MLMKKIMILSPGLTGGGTERVSAILANYFIGKNFKVVFLALYTREKTYHLNPLAEFLYVHTRKSHKILALGCRVKSIRKMIKEQAIDYIVDFSTTEGVLGAIFTKAERVAALRNDPKNDGRDLYTRFFRWVSYALAKNVIFQTAEAKQYYPEFIRRKAYIVLNPITKELPRWEIDQTNCTIVAVGRLTSQKNFRMLIDAAAIIHSDFPDFKVLIYGDGEERDMLTDYISRKAMTGVVEIREYIKDIHDIMKKAYIYVSTSDYEGLSNSMIEALGIGVPTICTDCSGGGARAAIINNENGILVPIGDTTALASAIIRLIRNPSEARKLSAEARKINQKLDIDVIGEQWVAIISQKQVESKIG
jgi:Glycosyltransferase